MDRLILNWLPLTTIHWASPAMSILKSFMESNGYKTKMHEKKNLGVILLEKDWFDNNITFKFIEEAIEKNIFTFEEYRENELKPIRLMPVLNIQNNIEMLRRDYDRSVGEKSLRYLSELTVYVNNSCDLNCVHCDQSYKQFMCCKTDKCRNEIDVALLTKIVSQTKYVPIEKINIIGGNIFSYPHLEKIPEIFSEKKGCIHFWSHYKNFQSINQQVNWDIIVDFSIDKQIFSNCINSGNKETMLFHFIVQNEEEVNLAEETANNFDIQNFEIHPFYNGKNLDFFKSGIFLNKEDILENITTQRQIFCNQALNSNFFGHLIILPNGDVVSNINTPVLGNINNKTILDLITEELDKNYSWLKTRNEPPCNSCLFQYLCPPVSNYEMIFNKPNLCTVN